MAFTAGYNNIIVKVKHKYIKNITSILKMSAIQQGATVDPADYVNIMGEIVSIPLAISTRREYKGYSTKNIEVGDTAIFSYLVIYDLLQLDPEAEPIYRNRIFCDGEEYFAVDITKLFAVIKNGEIKMLNGYVMVQDIEADPKILLQQHTRRQINTISATVACIGDNLEGIPAIDVKQGDLVYFPPNIIQRYQINNKPFGILKQSHILGKAVIQEF